MIAVLHEDKDGVFCPTQALHADWFIVIGVDGVKTLSDSQGNHKQVVPSIDDAVRVVEMLNSSLV